MIWIGIIFSFYSGDLRFLIRGRDLDFIFFIGRRWLEGKEG